MIEAGNACTGFAEVNGAKLYYEFGGEGYPLLLLHAGVGDSRMWDDQFGVFAQQFKVIRYDLRGWGKSVVGPGMFSSHEDVAGLLNFLGVRKMYVIGLSFGGRVAIDFTLAHPEVVDALILGAPAVSGYEFSEGVQRFAEEEDDLLDLGDLAAATELNLRMWVDGPYRTPDRVDPAVRERVREMQMQAFTIPIPEEVEEQELTSPAIMRLDEIRAPVLIIVGDQDVSDFLKIADVLATRIKGARKVIIPGVAHLPNMEKPREFNEIVLDFLSEQAR
jgi:3-oxoadipate enol-lactonase